MSSQSRPHRVSQETLAREGMMVQKALGDLFAKTNIFHPESIQIDNFAAGWETIRPVPLHRYLQGVPLLPVPIPRLTAAKATQWLGEIYGWEPPDSQMDSADSTLSGLLVLSRGPGGFLFYNADDPLPRQRFSIAHELGHFLLHADRIRDELKDGRILALEHTPDSHLEDPEYENRERQANRFATELLIPDKIVRAVFQYAFPQGVDQSTTQHHMPKLHRIGWLLAQRLLVSDLAMHYRFSGLKLTPFIYSKKPPEIWP